MTIETSDLQTVVTSTAIDTVMATMDEWKETCASDKNVRVSGSFQVQLYTLLRRIESVCPAMPALTYDIRLDPNFDIANDDAEFSPDTSIWYALGFYLGRNDGLKKNECHRNAIHLEKSIRSGVYNLKSQSMGTKPPLYVTSHTKDARDIEIVTFNPHHQTKAGKTVSEVAGERIDKRWESVLVSKIATENGLSTEDAKEKLKDIKPFINSKITQALEHKETKFLTDDYELIEAVPGNSQS